MLQFPTEAAPVSLETIPTILTKNISPSFWIFLSTETDLNPLHSKSGQRQNILFVISIEVMKIKDMITQYEFQW